MNNANQLAEYMQSIGDWGRQYGLNGLQLLSWAMQRPDFKNCLRQNFGVDVDLLGQNLEKFAHLEPNVVPETTSVTGLRIQKHFLLNWANSVRTSGEPNIEKAFALAILQEPLPCPVIDILLRSKLHPRYLDPQPESETETRHLIGDFIQKLESICSNASVKVRENLAQHLAAYVQEPSIQHLNLVKACVMEAIPK